MSNEYDTFPPVVEDTPPVSVRSGSELAKFRIDWREIEVGRRIGRGAFGEVFLSTWRGSMVVVKQLPSGDASEDDFDAFLAEAKILGSIRPHPNVVQFLGCCLGDKLGIVVEYLEKGDLLHYVRMHVTSMETRITMALDAALGMLHLHRENIVHCDLAARNLLVYHTGSRIGVKISDFGLAKVGARYVSRSGVGPVKWMAPEAIRGRVYSQESDIWSFGTVLWEIVSHGKEPFGESGDLVALALAICKGLKEEVPEDCPDTLRNLINQCWALDPHARPSFAEVVRILQYALQDYSGDEVESSSPHSTKLQYIEQELDSLGLIPSSSSSISQPFSSNSPYPTLTLLSLPDQILRRILGYVDGIEIVRSVRLTCKAIDKVAVESIQSMNLINVNGMDMPVIYEHCKQLGIHQLERLSVKGKIMSRRVRLEHFPILPCLSVDFRSISFVPVLDIHILQSLTLISCFTSLKGLFTQLTQSNIHTVKLHNLPAIHPSDVTRLPDTVTTLHMGALGAKLTSVTDAVVGHFKNVMFLNLVSCPKFHGKVLPELKKLVKLELIDCPAVSVKRLPATLPSSLASLQCAVKESAGKSWLASLSPLISTIDICGNLKLRMNELTFLDHVYSLTIRECPSLVPEMLFRMSTAVTKLSLYHCKGICRLEFSEGHHTSLISLTIHNCPLRVDSLRKLPRSLRCLSLLYIGSIPIHQSTLDMIMERCTHLVYLMVPAVEGKERLQGRVGLFIDWKEE